MPHREDTVRTVPFSPLRLAPPELLAEDYGVMTALPILSRRFRPSLRACRLRLCHSFRYEFSIFDECPTRVSEELLPAAWSERRLSFRVTPKGTSQDPISHCLRIYIRFPKMKRTVALAPHRTTMIIQPIHPKAQRS